MTSILLLTLYTAALAGKLCDPDDKIRAAVCKLYSQLDYETVLHRVSDDQLRAIGERCLDKKVRSDYNHINDFN